MKIFITGGTGFVGRHVVAELQKRDHHLLLLVRKPEDASGFHSKKNLSFLIGDFSHAGEWQKEVKKFKPNGAIHLAWEGIPDYGYENSLKNLESSLATLEFLKRVGCKKIIVAGSCWEYGAKTGKINEDHPLNISNAFQAAKTAIHFLGRELFKGTGIDFIWARFFYVYGPGQKSHSLIPHLMENFRQGKPVDIKNPRAANDFVYVDDVASALRMILERHKIGQSGIYNIGSGRLTSVMKIAKYVLGSSGKIPKSEGFYADIGRIKKEIGWVPRTSILVGIKKQIKI